MRTLTTIVLILILFFAIACEKITTVNPVPVITFKEFTLSLIDTLGNTYPQGKLRFGFVDGDGADLADANVTYTNIYGQAINGDTLYSIILTPYIKVDTQYVESDFDTINNYLIYDSDMNIAKVGQNKTLKGEIEVSRLFLYVPADTLRFDFYIVDRDGNKSNVETTPDIGFR